MDIFIANATFYIRQAQAMSRDALATFTPQERRERIGALDVLLARAHGLRDAIVIAERGVS